MIHFGKDINSLSSIDDRQVSNNRPFWLVCFFSPRNVLMGITLLFLRKLCVHFHEHTTAFERTELYPRVASRGLEWENKLTS